MKYIKLLVLFVAAFFAASVNASEIYNDSGSGGSGTSYVNDVSGPVQVNYDSYTWSAYYDDTGFAYYTYTLYTSSGQYDVFAVYGGPPPSPASWSHWGAYSDNLSNSPPSFLTAFWLVAPQ
jgi:hypothetical protein